MAWLWLLLAGALEVVWAFAMQQSEGFTRPLPSAVTIIGLVASFILLSLSMRSLPLGTANTLWTGIGAVGAFIVGLVFLQEPAGPLRIGAAGLSPDGCSSSWRTAGADRGGAGTCACA